MQSLNDDVFDELGFLSGSAIRRLRNLYNTSQTQCNIEQELKHELEIVIRGAIEGLTNIPPEHIIIDLSQNDT